MRIKLERNPYDYRRKLPHLQFGPPLFITFSTLERWELPPAARQLAFESCMYEHQRRLTMHAVVVMPDHVHLLATVLNEAAGKPIPVYEILEDIKNASAHNINKLLHRHGQVWVKESFDRMLRAGEFEKYLEYIKMNPVRRGLVQNPDDYQWLWYEGQKKPKK